MKSMKKVMALLLSVVMTLAMCTAAFAAGTTTLTIKTTAGHTYKVYQLLAGDVSGLDANGSGTLANVTVGSSVINQGTNTTEKIINDLKDKKNGELGKLAYAFVNGGTAVGTVTGTGNNESITVAEG